MTTTDLHLFLDDLVAAAMNRWRTEPDGTAVPDRVTLALIEKACAKWRTPGRECRSDEPERNPIDELIGANLSLYEEELVTARLRLALASAQRGRRELRARVAELEKAAGEIRHLHKDSPMGPCPVCIDADAMVRGDDYTLPYPCPTARLAGAQDCDPPSQRAADETDGA